MTDFVDLVMQANHIGLMFVIGMLMPGIKKGLKGTKFWKWFADLIPGLLGALGALIPGVVVGETMGARLMLGVVIGACSSWGYDSTRRMLQARAEGGA